MANVPISNLTTTWNNVSTTFTGIKLNVTDTASAAASLLMDLQVGGSSKFSASKTGAVASAAGFSADGVSSPRAYAIGNSTNARGLEFFTGGNRMYYRDGSGVVASFGLTSGFMLGSTQPLGWAATTPDGSSDVNLFRDAAANTLAQRNGVNAQTFRLYNTFTDASNYERGKFEWASNALLIGTEKAGTGLVRALEFQTNGVTRMTINTDGNINMAVSLTIGSTSVFSHSGRVVFSSPAAGVYLLQNNTQTDWNRLQFGGTSASFPALKRSTTSLQARLADDTAFTNIQGKLTTEANAVSEIVVATHTLTIYDAAGTGYKVLAVAA
jgi:hypothetical protein